VELARLVSPHGVQGVMKAVCLCERPERLTQAKSLWLQPKQGPARKVKLVEAKFNGRQFYVRLEGITSPEAARALAGSLLSLERSEIKTEPGEILICDMKDLDVVEEGGRHLGRLAGIYSTGAQDVYEIAPERGETWLIPAIPQVVLKIDLEARRMTVHLLPGLEPGTDA
jgi:16S rRNA processing protein RimM